MSLQFENMKRSYMRGWRTWQNQSVLSHIHMPEGIGIRLENDILVTEGAPEDLNGDRLLNISDIENLMA